MMTNIRFFPTSRSQAHFQCGPYVAPSLVCSFVTYCISTLYEQLMDSRTDYITTCLYGKMTAFHWRKAVFLCPSPDNFRHFPTTSGAPVAPMWPLTFQL